MNSYRDEIGDLIVVIDSMIDKKIDAISKGQIVKVVDTDGFYVEVNTLNNKGEILEGDLTLKGIPILQGKGFSTPIKKDDLGILLNIQIDLSNILENKEYFDDIEHDYYVFMPIVSKTNFKSNANDLYITSNENKSTMILNDEKISLETEGNYTIETKGDLSIKGGSNAVEFGNSTGTLKTAFDAIFQAMDLIASGMTGTSTNPSAYNGGKSALQQQISQIFK